MTYSTHDHLSDGPVRVVAVVKDSDGDVSIVDPQCVEGPVMVTLFPPLLNTSCQHDYCP